MFALAAQRSLPLARTRLVVRYLAETAPPPPRPSVKRGTGITLQQRAALRQARKQQASRVLEEQTGTTKNRSSSVTMSRYMWYVGLAVPTVLLVWGIGDPDSPPAKVSKMIGLTGFIDSYTESIAKPSHEKLLPDWSQVLILFGYFVVCLVLVISLAFDLLHMRYLDAKCSPRYSCTPYPRFGSRKYPGELNVGSKIRLASRKTSRRRQVPTGNGPVL